MLAFLFLLWQVLRSGWDSVRDPAIRPLAIWLAILLAIGTNFYRAVEGWGWLDALYFSVITLATVGFGDLAPETAPGKVFTIMYVLSGMGILVAFVNATVQRSADRHRHGHLAAIAPHSPQEAQDERHDVSRG